MYIYVYNIYIHLKLYLTNICTKLTMETQIKSVKYAQSQQ